MSSVILHKLLQYLIVNVIMIKKKKKTKQDRIVCGFETEINI